VLWIHAEYMQVKGVCHKASCCHCSSCVQPASGLDLLSGMVVVLRNLAAAARTLPPLPPKTHTALPLFICPSSCLAV